jgi:hypothetical protein
MKEKKKAGIYDKTESYAITPSSHHYTTLDPDAMKGLIVKLAKDAVVFWCLLLKNTAINKESVHFVHIVHTYLDFMETGLVIPKDNSPLSDAICIVRKDSILACHPKNVELNKIIIGNNIKGIEETKKLAMVAIENSLKKGVHPDCFSVDSLCYNDVKDEFPQIKNIGKPNKKKLREWIESRAAMHDNNNTMFSVSTLQSPSLGATKRRRKEELKKLYPALREEEINLCLKKNVLSA